MQQNPETVPIETLPLLIGFRKHSVFTEPGPGSSLSPSLRAIHICTYTCSSPSQSQNRTIATSKPSLTPASPLVTSFSPPLHKQNFWKESRVHTSWIHSPPIYPSPTALNLLCKVINALPNSGHLVPAASTLTFFQKCFPFDFSSPNSFLTIQQSCLHGGPLLFYPHF